MATIEHIHARQIFDSRGNPTIEVEVYLDDGGFGRAAVPSGASKGKLEALELRDGDPKAFHGKGVTEAVRNVQQEIAPILLGQDALDQRAIDHLLLEADGTKNKERLGANAILGASLAVAHATADSLGLPLFRYIAGAREALLPRPMMNVLNGGAHADNSLDIQEFMILPLSAETFAEAVRACSEIFHTLKGLLVKQGLATGVGDEGGFAPDLPDNRTALDLLVEAIKASGYEPGADIALTIDAAATSFFEGGRYRFTIDNEIHALASTELVDIYADWVSRYPIVSIEDGIAEEDADGWRELTQRIGEKTQVVGDDVFVTNPERLLWGIEQGISNSILIKLNQIGTVSETLHTMDLARQAGYTCVVSHRSGETEDTSIADLAVGTACGQLKSGSISRSERVAKYNRLLRIEDGFGLYLAEWPSRFAP
ncbi:MAG: phosphopyruvate hydratase [Candidatus Bipolaricaulota bacterium]|nr:MAG: phosphopyruvate hydratase [Candidatus Bipolaricaulota bacterium]